MSFDFFGEGIVEAPKINFNPDEENFFKAKLPYLDPKSKGTIELGTVISFIKYSGLPPNIQKKILDNLKITGKSSIDYSEMKKIFRGIALAQNKIEPSLVNINANIRTKMPIFYDDDDEDQDEQPPKKTQPPPEKPNIKPPLQPKQQLKVVNDPKPNNQKPPTSPRASQTQQFLSSPQFKKFQQIWDSLETKGTLISGNQVKRAFGNSSNRKQLAKAWKICSVSEKGYLTKGQLFVFMHLIKEAKGQIPDSLNPKMKEIILKIDKKQQKQEKRTALSGSQMFDNFDKSQNFEPVRERSQLLEKSQAFSNLQKSQNLEKVQKLNSELAVFTNLQEKEKQKIDSITQKAVQQSKMADILLQNVHKLTLQAESSRTLLDQTDKFLSKVDERNLLIRQKMDTLKQNQDHLTDRLNQTCVKMRDLIVKQAEFIDELMGEMENQSQMNKERVTILENYTDSMNEQINMKMSSKHRKSKPSKVFIEEPPSTKTIEEKKQIKKTPSVENIHKEPEKIQSPKKQQPKQMEEKQPEEKKSPPPQNQEDMEAGKRLHAKRVYTIQMINFITPINQEEYPIIVQRITSMSQNQLDGLYAQLYKKYEQKMEEENQKVENGRPLTNDEFSSNNFPEIPQQTHKQPENNVDFFDQ